MEQLPQTSKWDDKEFRSNYMKDYCSKYYQERKDLLSKKVTCSCGKEVSLSSLQRHMQSTLHKNKQMSDEEKIELYKSKIIDKLT